ncbi:T9SS type A sorting domain-containing protein [Chryseobacterium sp. PTM-20240506]|uniref:T9SS type A sorting domain-containing protein n=1 Tax=unclassified Chryseobacterium TaxID=2593645 RepID=UPI00235841DF|nr:MULTISPECIES: T9SS type A sorting domain-containing protein [unclassified Chryseobacterium]MDC8105795.1 T9SS type A sorting domain-containing protein [Chryseobacterium sp. B21-037]MDQ1804298.1 T9SS type A sorting domain-containing protein [Chryseobacterium sp. CKR4-1]
MKKIIKITVLLLVYNLGFGQTNYYVDKANGSDNNNGSSTAPWKTIQKAATKATPNSIVNIKAGTYYENVVINVSGTSGNYITFKNYANDNVIIDGTNTPGSTLLTVTNKSFLKFENLTIQNKTVNDAQGVLVQTTGIGSSTDLTFKNIKVTKINWNANKDIPVNPNNNAQGFIVYGRNGGITNLTIDECKVFNNILGYSEALAVNGNIDGFIVKNCKVYDNTNIGIDILGHEGTASNTSLDEARNGVVINNECYNNVAKYATSAGIYVDGARNITIERNKSYQNGYGIEVGAERDGIVQQITVKNNLIYKNKEAGLSIGGFDDNTTGQVINSVIRNNTFLQNDTANKGSGEISMSKASNCTFENNIFYTGPENLLMFIDNKSPQSNNTFNYNCWYTPNNDQNDIAVDWRGTTYDTFAAYRSATGQDANSLYANPSLVSISSTTPIVKLNAASVCINKGKPTTAITSGELDFYGAGRISNTIIDIGASEYSATLGTTTNEILNFGTISPNPSSGIFNFELDADKKPYFITVYNMGGQELKKYNFLTNRFSIDLSGLTEGTYFVKMQNKNGVSSKKIIIKK